MSTTMSTATSWSSSRGGEGEPTEAEAATPRSEYNSNEEITIIKGDDENDEIEVEQWVEDGSLSSSSRIRLNGLTSGMGFGFKPREPLDLGKLSRIAQVFGVAVPRLGGGGGVGGVGGGGGGGGVGGVGGGIRSDRLVSSSTSTITRYGIKDDPMNSNGITRRHVSSGSITIGGGLRTLTMVEAKNGRSNSITTTTTTTTAAMNDRGLPSPTNSMFSRTSTGYTTSRRTIKSQDLITVIPPDHLFLPSIIPPLPTNTNVNTRFDIINSDSATSINARQSQKEIQRWRRGRILPFRSSLREMINLIVREWGLPSSVGVVVYLVTFDGGGGGGGGGGDGGDGGDHGGDHGHYNDSGDDLESGSLIGSEAWSILWRRVSNHQRIPTSIGNSQNIRNFSAPSPLGKPISQNDGIQSPSFASIDNKSFLTPTTSTFALSQTLESPLSRSAASSPGKSIERIDDAIKRQADLGQGFPLSMGTTRRSGNSSFVVGKIEFDIDRRKAVWYDLWNQRRKDSAERIRADGGMRKLMLSGKREEMVEEGTVASDDESDERQELDTAYAQLEDQEDIDPLADVFPTDQVEFAALKQSRRANRRTTEFDIKDIGSDAILDDHVNLEAIDKPVLSPPDDLDDVMKMLRHQQTGHILASPIEIPSPDLGRTNQMRTKEQRGMHGLGIGLFETVDKRGSGLVMSDNLNDLEQVLRGLHPQDLQVDQPPTRSSTLKASASRENNKLIARSRVSPEVREGIRTSPSAKAMIDILAASSSSGQTASGPPIVSSWPAVAFNRTPDTTPLLPSTSPQNHLGLSATYTPRSAPDGSTPIPLSPETMMRMEYHHLPAPRHPAATVWKPQRPARPPTPIIASLVGPLEGVLGGEEIVLPADTSSKVSVPIALAPPRDNTDDEKKRGPTRGLRSQMSVPKLSKIFKRDSSSAQDNQAVSMEDGGGGGTVVFEETRSRGRRPSIWSKHGESTSNLSISAPLSPEQVSELETLVESLPPKETMAPTVTAKSSKNRRSFGKRLFKGGFGSGNSSKPQSPIMESNAKMGDRVQSLPTSPPTTSPAIPQSPEPEGHVDRPRSPTTSPRSPTSVRRKPVPKDGEMVNSPSLAESMASFVLEQAPAGQRRVRERE